MRVTPILKSNVTSALPCCAGDRRGADRMRRGGERNVAFARQQARRRIEADPARARHIDFGPGMQIGEIDCRCRPGRRATSRRASAGSGSRTRSAPRGRGGAGSAPAATRCRGTSPRPSAAFLPASARRAPCGSDSGCRSASCRLRSHRKSIVDSRRAVDAVEIRCEQRTRPRRGSR